MPYIIDFAIIALQLIIILEVGTWIHGLLEIKREVIKNKCTSMREAMEVEEDDGDEED